MNEHERAVILHAVRAFNAALDHYVDLDAPFEPGERAVLHDAEHALAQLRHLATNTPLGEPAVNIHNLTT